MFDEAESLSDAEVAQFIKGDLYDAINIGKIKGRYCNLQVLRKDSRLLIEDYWLDHTKSQLIDLLKSVNHSLERIAL